MKLKYLQKNYTFELVRGPCKSKASSFILVVVVVVASARLSCGLPFFKVVSRIFGGIWKYTFNSSKSCSNVSLNSSKKLTIKEQRTLAQLLRVVLVVVVVLELRLLDCHMLVLGCISKKLFPCLALKNQIVSMYSFIAIDLGKGKA